jgi:hypothetical protein
VHVLSEAGIFRGEVNWHFKALSKDETQICYNTNLQATNLKTRALLSFASGEYMKSFFDPILEALEERQQKKALDSNFDLSLWLSFLINKLRLHAPLASRRAKGTSCTQRSY